MKSGGMPGTGDYDAASYSSNSNESVDINTNSGTTYFILMHAYRAFNDVTLTLDTGGSDPEVETVNSSVMFYDEPAGDRYFLFPKSDPSPNAPLEVRVRLAHDRGSMFGQVELYMKEGSLPTPGDYDQKIVVDNGTATPTNSFFYPNATGNGEYYLLLRGLTDYSNFWLENFTF